MVDNLPITVLGEHDGVGSCDSGTTIISLELDILSEPAHFRIGVVQGQARLADIVPMARSISTKIGQVVRRNISSSGIPVPCRKGCAVCCYSLTTVTVPEAFRLMEEARMMPLERYKDVMQSCLQMTKRYPDQYLSNSFGPVLPAYENQCARTKLTLLALFWRSPDSPPVL